MLGIAERITRECILRSDDRGDIAGEHLINFLARIGVHADQASNALTLVAARRVQQRLARGKTPRVDAHIRKTTDIRIGHDLECESGGWLVLVRASRFLFGQIVWIRSAYRWNIQG